VSNTCIVAGPGDADTGDADTTSQRASQRKYFSREELVALKPVMKELYIDKGLTFKELQMILDTQYNCRIT